MEQMFFSRFSALIEFSRRRIVWLVPGTSFSFVRTLTRYDTMIHDELKDAMPTSERKKPSNTKMTKKKFAIKGKAKKEEMPPEEERFREPVCDAYVGYLDACLSQTGQKWI